MFSKDKKEQRDHMKEECLPALLHSPIPLPFLSILKLTLENEALHSPTPLDINKTLKVYGLQQFQYEQKSAVMLRAL